MNFKINGTKQSQLKLFISAGIINVSSDNIKEAVERLKQFANQKALILIDSLNAADLIGNTEVLKEIFKIYTTLEADCIQYSFLEQYKDEINNFIQGLEVNHVQIDKEKAFHILLSEAMASFEINDCFSLIKRNYRQKINIELYCIDDSLYILFHEICKFGFINYSNSLFNNKANTVILRNKVKTEIEEGSFLKEDFKNLMDIFLKNVSIKIDERFQECCAFDFSYKKNVLKLKEEFIPVDEIHFQNLKNEVFEEFKNYFFNLF